MKVRLAYGKTGLDVELSDSLDVTVVEPKYLPGLPYPEEVIREALNKPIGSPSLKNIVTSSDKIGIIFNDITRPTPYKLLLPILLNELANVEKSNITLFNALGTHRPNTNKELQEMLGKEVFDNYLIIQNNPFNYSTQEKIGSTSRGHDIWINKELLDCDLKILTGFIEPHFFAGFSGGGKAVMPGMAGIETILGNHSAEMIDDPQATWGITHGNPIWDEIHEIANKMDNLFLLNVTLNKHKQITGVFAGQLTAAHEAGCKFVKENAMMPLSHPYDIVISTNSGYPLDLNLYQSVKGMSAASQIVRPGGAIIIATSCWDGVPDHGLYGQLLREARSPKDLLETIKSPGFSKVDQWQAQIQAQILLKAKVIVKSDNLTPEEIKKALLDHCTSIEDAIHDLLKEYGPKAKICILPEGPQTIPYILTP
jgi:nickel-dependent lactate racemase